MVVRFLLILNIKRKNEVKALKDYTGVKIPANYCRGIESVGGHISFDEEGLTFKSHDVNIQTCDLHIDYSQIQAVNKRNTLGIVPNGILLITNDGNKYKFVINGRTAVMEFLLSRK